MVDGELTLSTTDNFVTIEATQWAYLEPDECSRGSAEELASKS
jgi:hypothetical protein